MAQEQAVDVRWLSVREMADRFGMSPTFVYRHVERGTIPHYRFGRSVRFKLAEIEDWARQFSNGTPPTVDA